jgi:hypothetical protein
MNWNFLRSDSAQSAMRITVMIITFCVAINLLILPYLIFLCISSNVALTWLGDYVYALAALGGTGVAGKVIQKKYESSSYSSYDSTGLQDSPSYKIEEDPLPKGPNGEQL